MYILIFIIIYISIFFILPFQGEEQQLVMDDDDDDHLQADEYEQRYQDQTNSMHHADRNGRSKFINRSLFLWKFMNW